MRRAGAGLIVTAVLLCLVRGPADAQMPCMGPGCPPPTEPSEPSEPWISEGTVVQIAAFTLNTTLGGLTAGIRQARRGDSFRDGFLRGAAGGAGVYAGKRVVAEQFPGSRLLGRQVSAVGASVTRNAGEGLPLLDRLILPIGPARFHVRTRGDPPVRASLDVSGSVAMLGALALDLDARADWPATLASGLPVLRVNNWSRDLGWHARNLGGAILIREDWAADPEMARLVLAHEQIHTLQYDQAFILWSDPLERRILRRFSGDDALARRIDLTLNAPVTVGLNHLIPYDYQPWQIEAHFLTDTWDLIGY